MEDHNKSSLKEKTRKSVDNAYQTFYFRFVELKSKIMKKRYNIVPYYDLQCIIIQYLMKHQRKKNGTNEFNNSAETASCTHSDQDCIEKNSHTEYITKTHAESVLNDFYRYNKRQSDCIMIFDVEQISNEDLQKTIRNNFDGKMTTEMRFFECLTVLFSQSKSNVVTLEMLEEAVRVAGPNVRIFFERAKGQSSTVKLGYVVHFPEDCRLFMHIPIICGSELDDKEQIYLEEHPRTNPKFFNGTRRQCS